MDKKNDKLSLKRQLAASSFKLLLAKHWLPTEQYTVLMYHRIIDPNTSPFPLQSGMYVKPETFEMHLDYLTKNSRVISLMELINEIETDTKPSKKKTVAITFDDGWNDFEYNAYPIIKKFNTPVSVFIPTAYPSSSKLFWTDQLALNLKVISTSEKLNSILKRIEENCHDSKLADLIKTSIYELKEENVQSLDTLIEHLKLIDQETRRNLSANLLNYAKEYCSPICEPQFLSWESISELSKDPLITFGSHSHQHSIMTHLTKEQIKDELTESIQIFKEKEIPSIPVFCYPNQNRNKETDSLLKEAGFSHSLGKIDEEESDTINPPCISRIGIHEDVAKNESLFSLRIWYK